MKNVLLKILITSMLITIFSVSLFQPIATSVAVIQNDTYETEIIDNVEGQISTLSNVPPRQPAKNPLWLAITVTAAEFVEVIIAEKFVSSAINNGLDWARDKYGHITGIKIINSFE